MPQSPWAPESLGWQDSNRRLCSAPGHMTAGQAPWATIEVALEACLRNPQDCIQLSRCPLSVPSLVSCPTTSFFCSFSCYTRLFASSCMQTPARIIWRGGQVGRSYLGVWKREWERAWKRKLIKNTPMLATSKSPRFVFSSSSYSALALLMHGVSRRQRVPAPKERTHPSSHTFFWASGLKCQCKIS